MEWNILYHNNVNNLLDIGMIRIPAVGKYIYIYILKNKWVIIMYLYRFQYFHICALCSVDIYSSLWILLRNIVLMKPDRFVIPTNELPIHYSELSVLGPLTALYCTLVIDISCIRFTFPNR